MNRRGLWVVLILFGGLFFVLFGLLAVTAQAVGGKSFAAPHGQGVGILEIKGEIRDCKEELRILRGFDEEPTIKSLLVRIDSPGGSVAPSQEIFSELRRFDKKKPVIVSMGNVAASGGYYIALGGRKIFANPGTMTGSIGVIMQTVDASNLIAFAKLDWSTYKSGTFKDMGSPFRAPTEPEQKVFNTLISNVYDQFVTDIVEARKLPEADVRAVADGRVYTGQQALKHKLIDELGGFQAALDAAASAGDIKGKPDIVYPPSDDGAGFFVDLVREASKTAVSTAFERGIAESLNKGLNNAQTVPKYLLTY